MGIEKIISIKNVGRFVALAPKGDVKFRRMTIIYGGNGYGKTTLAGILRSLRTGDPAYITERATLGGTGAPEVQLRLDSQNADFKNGTWNVALPELEIFDSTFISENVYTGEHVDAAHRKNLYEVIVGASAVAVAREIDRIDGESRATANEISRLETKLRGDIQAPFEINDFLTLPPVDDLEGKIRDATTRLSAVRKAKEILSRRELETLSVPESPRHVLGVLAKGAEQLAASTEDAVRRHIQKRLDRRGEQWVRQGLEYLRTDNQCPFCTQDVSKVQIVDLFREYFSAAYRDHLVAIERAVNEVEQRLGEQALARLQRQILENDGRIQGWADLSDLSYARVSLERFDGVWRHLRTLLQDALKRKLANPAEVLGTEPAFEAAFRDFDDAAAALVDMNKSVARANEEIGALKKQAAGTGEEALERDLRRLRNTQIRAKADVAKACDDLQQARAHRKQLDDEKKSRRAELEAMAQTVLAKYEAAINRLLRNFGGGFAISGIKPTFAGGKASSTYRIAVNDVPLDLGDAGTPRGTPCFRTALSSGDKSTLALAFFLARLEQDPEIAKKTVVLDDPLTSLDAFRLACTQQEIRRIAVTSAQTIVLSHDVLFLKRIYDNHDKADLKCLHVVRDKQSYVLQEWDVARYCLKEAHQDYFILRSFLEEGATGDLLTVARAIRPYLEGHMRHRFPAEFAPTEWLGDMVAKVRGAGSASALLGEQAKLGELEALNDYSKQFHHTGPGAAPPTTTETELRAFAGRAIRYVQGP
ncbi:MAG: AAA family ATPase [Sandaracinaceae bacterium]|nr:AAA family ATPase [Sandaracinaceae bacterium]